MVSGFTLGGEQSGHVIMSDHATTGDGILTALHVLERMVTTGRSLADLAAVMTRLPQVLVNVPGVDKARTDEDAVLAAAVAEEEADLAGRGRILLRPSGTEPLVRVMVEAPTAGRGPLRRGPTGQGRPHPAVAVIASPPARRVRRLPARGHPGDRQARRGCAPRVVGLRARDRTGAAVRLLAAVGAQPGRPAATEPGAAGDAAVGVRRRRRGGRLRPAPAATGRQPAGGLRGPVRAAATPSAGHRRGAARRGRAPGPGRWPLRPAGRGVHAARGGERRQSLRAGARLRGRHHRAPEGARPPGLRGGVARAPGVGRRAPGRLPHRRVGQRGARGADGRLRRAAHGLHGPGPPGRPGPGGQRVDAGADPGQRGADRGHRPRRLPCRRAQPRREPVRRHRPPARGRRPAGRRTWGSPTCWTATAATASAWR